MAADNLTSAGAPRDKILDRVRKMLALANDDGATEGERDNALRMAHATLAKHQLTLAELSSYDREREDPRGRLDTEGWNLKWCQYLRNSIARLFFCKYVSYGKINATKGRHCYIGRESNAATAAYMSDWIIQSVLREADRRFGHRLTAGGRSFGYGVVAALDARISDILAASQRSVDGVSTGTALVVADYYRSELTANDEWVAANIGKLRTGRPGGRVQGDAYAQGKAHGATINLNRQLGTTSPVRGRLS